MQLRREENFLQLVQVFQTALAALLPGNEVPPLFRIEAFLSAFVLSCNNIKHATPKKWIASFYCILLHCKVILRERAEKVADTQKSALSLSWSKNVLRKSTNMHDPYWRCNQYWKTIEQFRHKGTTFPAHVMHVNSSSILWCLVPGEDNMKTTKP